MTCLSRRQRWLAWTLALPCSAMLLASPALAQNEFCTSEIMPLVKQRDALTQRLKALGKQGAQPGAREKFCGTLDEYMGVIRKTVSYMEQNKDFCSIPDQAITGIKKGLAQNTTMRYRVCVVGAKQAAQAQQGQQAQAAQQQRPGMVKPPTDLQLQ